MNRILIGYMGSGKSSVGRYLAAKMDMVFLDTDELIERQQGCSISRIFEEQGEEAFRQMETECLRQLTEEKKEGIIAVGGGTPLREENRSLMRRLGRVYYLEANADTLFQRLKDDLSRPLLKTDDLREKIEAMLKDRRAAYEEAADRILQADGKEIEEIVEEIIKDEGTGDQRA